MKTVKIIKSRIVLASATIVTAALVSFGSYACSDSVAMTPAMTNVEMAVAVAPVGVTDSLSLMGDDFKKVANCSSRNINISISPPSLNNSLELKMAAIN